MTVYQAINRDAGIYRSYTRMERVHVYMDCIYYIEIYPIVTGSKETINIDTTSFEDVILKTSKSFDIKTIFIKKKRSHPFALKIFLTSQLYLTYRVTDNLSSSTTLQYVYLLTVLHLNVSFRCGRLPRSLSFSN